VIATTHMRKRCLRLVLAAILIVGIWTIVLPWIAKQPAERDRWKTLQQAGIDPSAMYYSELEAMAPILHRLNDRQRGNSHQATGE
jgi:hypothetical protein